MSLEVFPVKATKKQGKFDLYDEIKKLVKENGVPLNEGDILVISSKYISNSQGRILDHNSIKSSQMAGELSRKFSINQKLSEAIIRESDVIFGGVSGFVITSLSFWLIENFFDISFAFSDSLIASWFNILPCELEMYLLEMTRISPSFR